MKIFKRILLGLLIVIALLVVGFIIWGSTPSGPMPEAQAAMESTGDVTVNDEGFVVFEPVGSDPTTGFIFYPGGRVDYRSYAPMAQAIADRGYLVAVVPMPLSLAVLKPGAADAVIAAYPEIQHWVIGGHSLGGAMAANFAAKNPGAVDGLVFLAAYPAGSDDLTQSGIKVLSISGSNDGLATPDKIQASRKLLPTDTSFMEIEGGNHAQFGWYGPQGGDNEPTITREEQQAQVVAAVVAFLEGLK